MNLKRHIIVVIVSGALMAAFQYVAIIWSFADFHPGYIPDLSEELHRRARIGHAMARPFVSPVLWLGSATGGYNSFHVIVQWFVIPLCYSALLYGAYAFLRKQIYPMPKA